MVSDRGTEGELAHQIRLVSAEAAGLTVHGRCKRGPGVGKVGCGSKSHPVRMAESGDWHSVKYLNQLS